ncbi:XrtA system polysaccharide deacetylase [Neoroseomonas lacus]|uniref:Chitooligosaccharide deacetylase n=1 Tax=Neoroseomonas lacus TaxID=287609 RepID=A0A917NF95_9PROT|nr:XrtA system polysaccharide deacetylase [Neoroseomonas lacus]GGI97474.1 polysaccharide deacetylase [Neoroseomonas lacus]
MTGTPIRNAMSVDVEDWFQVQAFASVIPRENWESCERRVEANTHRVLDLFAAAQMRGTFFTLGWVAERHPALIRRIVKEGHELASHGHGHQQVHVIGEAAFRADIRRARAILEQAGGVRVVGYRAPTFSISARHTPWAHPILAEEGYLYSSSVFPVRHDLYGDPSAPRRPYLPHPDGVTEIPMTTVRAFGRSLPCAGGGWFRLLPYGLTRAGLGRVNGTEGQPGVFYFHPWEIDPDQPRAEGAGRLSRFRHYTGLRGMEARLVRLLAEFRWGRMDEVFGAVIAAPLPAAA